MRNNDWKEFPFAGEITFLVPKEHGYDVGVMLARLKDYVDGHGDYEPPLDIPAVTAPVWCISDYEVLLGQLREYFAQLGFQAYEESVGVGDGCVPVYAFSHPAITEDALGWSLRMTLN